MVSDIEGCKPRGYDHNEALVFWARIWGIQSDNGRTFIEYREYRRSRQDRGTMWRKNAQLSVPIGGNRVERMRQPRQPGTWEKNE